MRAALVSGARSIVTPSGRLVVFQRVACIPLQMGRSTMCRQGPGQMVHSPVSQLLKISRWSCRTAHLLLYEARLSPSQEQLPGTEQSLTTLPVRGAALISLPRGEI